MKDYKSIESTMQRVECSLQQIADKATAMNMREALYVIAQVRHAQTCIKDGMPVDEVANMLMRSLLDVSLEKKDIHEQKSSSPRP